MTPLPSGPQPDALAPFSAPTLAYQQGGLGAPRHPSRADLRPQATRNVSYALVRALSPVSHCGSEISRSPPLVHVLLQPLDARVEVCLHFYPHVMVLF